VGWGTRIRGEETSAPTDRERRGRDDPGEKAKGEALTEGGAREGEKEVPEEQKYGRGIAARATTPGRVIHCHGEDREGTVRVSEISSPPRNQLQDDRPPRVTRFITRDKAGSARIA